MSECAEFADAEKAKYALRPALSRLTEPQPLTITRTAATIMTTRTRMTTTMATITVIIMAMTIIMSTMTIMSKATPNRA